MENNIGLIDKISLIQRLHIKDIKSASRYDSFCCSATVFIVQSQASWARGRRYSTAADLIGLRGWSASVPLSTAVWYEGSYNEMV